MISDAQHFALVEKLPGNPGCVSQERNDCALRNKIKHEIQAEAMERDRDAEGGSSTRLSGRPKLVFVSFDT